jgi:hypothetical protein
MSTVKFDTWENAAGTRTYAPVHTFCSWAMNGTQTIKESLNVSSITDTGTGNTDVNLTTALANTDYCAVGAGGTTVATNPGDTAISIVPNTTSVIMVEAVNSAGSNADPQYAAIQVTGGV